MFAEYSQTNNTGKAANSMKLLRKKEEDVKVYEPKKERIRRIQQQLLVMSRVLTG